MTSAYKLPVQRTPRYQAGVLVDDYNSNCIPYHGHNSDKKATFLEKQPFLDSAACPRAGETEVIQPSGASQYAPIDSHRIPATFLPSCACLRNLVVIPDLRSRPA